MDLGKWFLGTTRIPSNVGPIFYPLSQLLPSSLKLSLSSCQTVVFSHTPKKSQFSKQINISKQNTFFLYIYIFFYFSTIANAKLDLPPFLTSYYGAVGTPKPPPPFPHTHMLASSLQSSFSWNPPTYIFISKMVKWAFFLMNIKQPI